MTVIKEETFLPVVTKAYCNKCGTEMKKEDLGYMMDIKDGRVVKKNSKRFLYTCPNCQHQEQSDIDYPYVKYKKVNLRTPAELNGGAR